MQPAESTGRNQRRLKRKRGSAEERGRRSRSPEKRRKELARK
jgi:hypothetical protein